MSTNQSWNSSSGSKTGEMPSGGELVLKRQCSCIEVSHPYDMHRDARAYFREPLGCHVRHIARGGAKSSAEIQVSSWRVETLRGGYMYTTQGEAIQRLESMRPPREQVVCLRQHQTPRLEHPHVPRKDPPPTTLNCRKRRTGSQAMALDFTLRRTGLYGHLRNIADSLAPTPLNTTVTPERAVLQMLLNLGNVNNATTS